ncbi:MAG: hypothetical protein GX610_24480 [Rhodococcus sp.]|nr:hypothetical protein [Rhodococcus sp. (in: high G+C Gram-positive bacteria)]
MECLVASPLSVSTSALAVDASALDLSCSRLRSLNPDYPRMYAVAPMENEGKRRWWKLSTGLDGDRVPQMWARALDDVEDPHAAAIQVATALVHAVVGRVAASVVLDGRAWDPGFENLWIHMDNDCGIDWVGVQDETMRALPNDDTAGSSRTVVVPCERALLVWTAHRCITSLVPIHRAVSRCAQIDWVRFSGLVGESVLGAAAHVPVLAGGGEVVAQRRGQGMLDAFVAAGMPVRVRPRPIRARAGVAAAFERSLRN